MSPTHSCFHLLGLLSPLLHLLLAAFLGRRLLLVLPVLLLGVQLLEEDLGIAECGLFAGLLCLGNTCRQTKAGVLDERFRKVPALRSFRATKWQVQQWVRSFSITLQQIRGTEIFYTLIITTCLNNQVDNLLISWVRTKY